MKNINDLITQDRLLDLTRTLVEIHRLRETAHAVLSAIATGKEPSPSQADELAEFIKGALGRSSLTFGRHRSVWSTPADQPHFVVDALALSSRSFRRSWPGCRTKFILPH